jgi:hypothetical protein
MMGVLIGTITGVMIFVGAMLASFGAAVLVTMHHDRKKAMRFDCREMMTEKDDDETMDV